MKLYELMYEQQPAKAQKTKSSNKHWFEIGLDWILRHLSVTGNNADYNRKV